MSENLNSFILVIGEEQQSSVKSFIHTFKCSNRSDEPELHKVKVTDRSDAPVPLSRTH